MAYIIVLSALVLLLCVISSKLSYKLGLPTLLLFILLGMLFGSDGIGGIAFDNFDLAQKVCSVALIFIMFYGGFGTNWKVARPVAVPSVLLSTAGVVVTAFLCGLFCHFILKMSLLEGMLLGSVVGSTDAASVFAILRGKNLGLTGGLDSLLEIESGSNDPIAYMLTTVVLALMGNGGVSVPYLLFSQIVYGLGIGALLAVVSIFVLRRVRFDGEGLHILCIVAVALLSYGLPELVGGNGYLSVYIVGIALGNSKLLHKRALVHFFDAMTWLMQIVLFFVLGLLSFPSRIPSIAPLAICVVLFLILIARPVAVSSVLCWFKVPFKAQLFVSFAGLRGAASIVFAIIAMSAGTGDYDIFHIVFFVALFSVGVQGTLLSPLAKKLGLADSTGSVMRTFTDYQEAADTALVEVHITENDPWAYHMIKDISIPEGVLIVMVRRKKSTIIPKGTTLIKAGDTLVLHGTDMANLAFEEAQHNLSLR